MVAVVFADLVVLTSPGEAKRSIKRVKIAEQMRNWAAYKEQKKSLFNLTIDSQLAKYDHLGTWGDFKGLPHDK